MLGRLQGLQEEGQPAERGGSMPGYQSGTKQRKGAARSCYTTPTPDPGISQIRIRGDRATASGTIQALADGVLKGSSS